MPFGQIFLFILTSIIQRLIAPKPTEPPPPALGEVEVPQVNEGAPIPVVFGTRAIKGATVVWYGDLRTSAITQESEGKK